MKTEIEKLIREKASRVYEHVANEPQFDTIYVDISMDDAISAIEEYANPYKVALQAILDTPILGLDGAKKAKQIASNALNQTKEG